MMKSTINGAKGLKTQKARMSAALNAKMGDILKYSQTLPESVRRQMAHRPYRLRSEKGEETDEQT